MKRRNIKPHSSPERLIKGPRKSENRGERRRGTRRDADNERRREWTEPDFGGGNLRYRCIMCSAVFANYSRVVFSVVLRARF
ncbi:hypothetical protein EVAR_32760_1 [Eumeta japonica]|uniref:Uncharacterized protein n=1 Tax=Eumeta variegata TaxID=151549 RepID=A0A4C1XNM0_EUMVA|nr:hypothetical protein EVAR_32760_1 [Eumeta japonica]